MEPNQKFGPEFDTLEKALEYRAEIMKDPKTPHPEHIGINTLTRVVDKEQTDEGVDTFNRAGYNPLRDKNDYLEKLNGLIELGKQQGQNKQMQDQIQQRILDLQTAAIAKGFIQAESRGHKILATKLKDVERAKKFASGELKVPTPQERQAQLAKQKQQVKEYGASGVVSATSNSNTNVATNANPVANPDAIKKATAAISALKSVTQSSAPPANIAKGLDAASQGTQVSGTDMKAIEKTMKDVKTISQNPELMNQMKPVLQKANQQQQKEKQQS
jgi:hypothetical protein